MRRRFQKMQLFERACCVHSDELQRFISKLTKNDRFAMEEIYQNTMLGALKGLDSLRDNGKMKAWIFAIARAESGRYYAANRTINHGINIEVERTNIDYLFDFTKYVEDREIIIHLLRNLSEQERQIYILHYYYDMPLKEVSELLNLNYSTIRSMHIRGMMKMRKHVSEGSFLYG